MNKNIYIKLINIHMQNLTYKLLLIFMGLGIWLTLSWAPSLSYIDMLYYASGNSWLITFFILPVFIIISYMNYNIIENTYFVYSRFKNKQQYYNFQITSNFLITTILFLKLLALIIILTNLYYTDGIIIANDKFYDIPNLVSCLFSYIKLYLFIMLVQNINIIIKQTTNKKSVFFALNFIIIYTIFDPRLLKNLSILDYINPARYIGFTYEFSNFISNVFYSSVYFFILLTITFFSLKNIILKKDIMGN